MVVLLFLACKESDTSDAWHGLKEREVNCNEMVFSISWEETKLWFGTKPFPVGYVPKRRVIQEIDELGNVRSQVTLVETHCK